MHSFKQLQLILPTKGITTMALPSWTYGNVFKSKALHSPHKSSDNTYTTKQPTNDNLYLT